MGSIVKLELVPEASVRPAFRRHPPLKNPVVTGNGQAREPKFVLVNAESPIV